jgi:hypothetical protein
VNDSGNRDTLEVEGPLHLSLTVFPPIIQTVVTDVCYRGQTPAVKDLIVEKPRRS